MLAFIDNPLLLAWLIGMLIVAFFVIHITFVKVPGQHPKQYKRARRWLFISRLIIFTCLFLALASLTVMTEQQAKGDLSLTILWDNSTSMSVYNLEAIRQTVADQQTTNTITVIPFGDDATTPLAEELLNHLEQDTNLLLVTDGNNNDQKNLHEVFLQANTLNTTVHALNLHSIEEDVAVHILGPEKVSPGIDNQFTVQLQGTHKGKAYPLTVTVDGKTMLNNKPIQDQYTFTHSFTSGNHQITAQTTTPDNFQANNIYHKSIRVIKRPAVFLYTKKTSPLTNLFDQLYAVTTSSTLNNLDPQQHYALVINDIHSIDVQQEFSLIKSYLQEDNGLLVIGGQAAFDKGAYGKQPFEQFLPTTTGVAEDKDEGIVTIVIALDTSSSVGTQYGQGSVADVEKALALSVIDNLKDNHQIGIIGFNTKGYTIQPVVSLKDNREAVRTKVATLEKEGGSYILSGIRKSIELLEPISGSKNIILISDGKSGGIGEANKLAERAKEGGITFYGIGVGEACIRYDKSNNCKEWSTEMNGINAVKGIARSAGGTYFHGEQTPQRIKLLFGDPDKSQDKDAFGLQIKDKSHFITQPLQTLNGKVTGFNTVLPKKTAQHLITTDTGEPLLVTWRYGVARVATLATDDGTQWAGQLLKHPNNRLYTSSMNWLIADPERKNKQFVHVSDTNIGRSTDLIVKSDTKPTAQGVTFYKKEDTYTATLHPTTIGFQPILDTEYAVNYNKELEAVGMNEQFTSLITSTGGELHPTTSISTLLPTLQTPRNKPSYGQTEYTWIFVLIALLVFLLEIGLRKARERKTI